MTADPPAPHEGEERAHDRDSDLGALVGAFRTHLEWLSLLGVRYVPGGASPRRRPPTEVVSETPMPAPPPIEDPLSEPGRSETPPQDIARGAARGAPSANSPLTAARSSDAAQVGEDVRALAQIGSGAAGLRAIRDQLGDCRRCRLAGERVQIVFGQGDPNAELMFVGEAPGRDEDLSGVPFVGAAGELLTKMIAAMGYERDQVYIGNVIKCRPPRNRDPKPRELAACDPFVRAQIAAVRPRVIVTLGRVAAQALLHTDQPVGRLRGRFHELWVGDTAIPLMPTYHPAYLLRSPQAKRPVWDDLKQVIARLRTTSG